MPNGAEIEDKASTRYNHDVCGSSGRGNRASAEGHIIREDFENRVAVVHV